MFPQKICPDRRPAEILRRLSKSWRLRKSVGKGRVSGPWPSLRGIWHAVCNISPPLLRHAEAITSMKTPAAQAGPPGPEQRRGSFSGSADGRGDNGVCPGTAGAEFARLGRAPRIERGRIGARERSRGTREAGNGTEKAPSRRVGSSRFRVARRAGVQKPELDPARLSYFAAAILNTCSILPPSSLTRAPPFSLWRDAIT